MEAQCEQAIELAFGDRSNRDLQAQANEFLGRLRNDTSGWQICLSLFSRDQRPSHVVSLVSLDIVNNAIKVQQLDRQSQLYIRDALMTRVRRSLTPTSANPEPVAIQNKIIQILVCLFTTLYPTEWTSFFTDFRTLAGDPASLGIANPPATVFYLRAAEAVHDEIADLLIPRSQQEQKQNTILKDMVRDRDAPGLVASWQHILSRWSQITPAMVKLCLVDVSKFVGWIDISLVVNADMLRSLWDIAGQQLDVSDVDQERAATRLAAIDTFTEIIGKKMPPADKIQMIRFIDANGIVQRLLSVDALSRFRKSSRYDTDLAESVAKLANAILVDIVKALDSDALSDELRQQTDSLLQVCIAHIIRFLSDEYDEVCSTVIPSLTDLLTFLRKRSETAQGLNRDHAPMLQSILDNVILKMKYDDTAVWGEDDEDAEDADFQALRARLHVLQMNIAAINDTMYMDTLSKLIENTFTALDRQSTTWQDLDLALHEMFLFGQLTVKNSGLYTKSAPKDIASQYLIVMMTSLVASGIATYPHPAVQLQYMEICVRYPSYFENHPDLTKRALQTFVRIIQTDHQKVKTRSWYLFLKFIRHLRPQLGDVARDVIQAVSSLLVIRSEVASASTSDDSDSDDAAEVESTHQLDLFEAVGCLCSIPTTSVQDQVLYVRAILEPLISDISQQLPAAVDGNDRAIMQLYRTIMALARFAAGVCDRMPGAASKPKAQVSEEVSTEFASASAAVLSALEALKHMTQIRTAARQFLTRMVGGLGLRTIQQLPRWLEGFLSQTSSRDELPAFLALIGQIIYGFKTDIYDILDQLIGPLLHRVFAGLAEPVNGTDDVNSLGSLKAQYLAFLLVVLVNELAGVLISPTNQATFEPLLSSLEHFCRDATDYGTAKQAYVVLTRMTSVWGGPDVGSAKNGLNENTQPAPVIPGFDAFVMSRFSPLTWALVRNPSFQIKDGQARSVLQEAAALQWTILRKCGAQYEQHLRTEELPGVGMSGDMIDTYLEQLRATDVRDFKKVFVNFVVRAAGGT